MRSQSMTSLLMYEAKNKPDIQDMVNRVDVMTDQDIDALSTPLPWFKVALKKLKAERMLEASVALMDGKPNAPVDQSGIIVRWDNEPTYLKFGAWDIFTQTGDLFFISDTGGVWSGSFFYNKVDFRIMALVEQERTVRSQYLIRYQESISNRA